MLSNSNEQATVRRYLLGQLGDEAREQFEQLLLTQDEAFAELLAVEDELVDDYLSGGLEPDEAEMFAKHFLSSAERQQKLRFAKAFNKYAATHATEEFEARQARTSSGSAWWPLFTASPWRAVAMAAVLLLAATAAWRVFIYRSDIDKGLIALNNAYKQQRPLESRITKLDYAPFVVTRGGEAPRFDSRERDVAERYLLDAARDHPGAASYHALGEFYLAERSFDKAIANFEEGLKRDPNNARLHSDLGAALLEKEKAAHPADESGKSFGDLAKSLDHLNRALELDGTLLEALFNRALVHEEMVLKQQAEEDWKNYLKKDAASKWADEARHHLTRLEKSSQQTSDYRENVMPALRAAYQTNDQEQAWEILRHSRDASAVGKLVWDQLLDNYLQASAGGQNNSAATELQTLAFVGNLELQKTGDAYTSELTRFYESSSNRQRQILTQARALMKQGRAGYANAKPLDAVDNFENAKLLFTKAGDHWEAQYAELWVAYSFLNATDTQRSLRILDKLVPSFESQKYEWLVMRALHILSGAEYNLGDYSRAIEHNHRSLALANQMGDAIGAFNTLSILIEQYRYIGNYEQSLACIWRSLSVLESCALSQNQIGQYYGSVASLLDSSGFYPAAVDYQKEAVRRALTTGQIQSISRAYANLGSIYGKLGDYPRALETARLAYETAKSHSDDSIKKLMMAYSARQIGDIYKLEGDLTKAIESYDECLKLYGSLDNRYGVYEAHKNRLSCYRAQGNDAAVKEELQTTFALIENNRATIREGDNRNHFFDIEQTVYDMAIDFEYSRMADGRKAFEYSEASRSRSLLDLVNSKARLSSDSSSVDIVFESFSKPLSLLEIQERMPNEAQLVQYSVLNDKLLIWFISKTNFSSFEEKITQEDLDRKVRSYVQSISNPAQQTQPTTALEAENLFDFLIKPLEGVLQKSKPVYVIPDKVLNYLPFGALRSADSKRFLVEDYVTAVSPSSSFFVVSSETARAKEGKKVERLLAVGNPNFDRAAFPTLARLPAAEMEAREVAGYYRSNCVLTGEAARKTRIQTEMERSDVIHLALHSVFDQRSPLRSKLLLTKPADAFGAEQLSASVLEASEIYRMKLPVTKIVVLSACQSGVEQYYGGEGMISLARPFLAVGVPLVIASFWAVDSDSTAELMTRFHQYRKQDNFKTAEALRRAQLDLLGSPDERLRQPFCWASFTAVGGWTSF